MPKSSAKTFALYDVDPGVAIVQKWVAELKPKTGRSLGSGPTINSASILPGGLPNSRTARAVKRIRKGI
jgi:hypothetical protein